MLEEGKATLEAPGGAVVGVLGDNYIGQLVGLCSKVRQIFKGGDPGHKGVTQEFTRGHKGRTWYSHGMHKKLPFMHRKTLEFQVK